MRRVTRFAVEDILPSELDVLQRFNLPRQAIVAPAFRALLADAATTMRRHARPRGVVLDVSAAEFESIYRGDGRNAEASPLEEIYSKAEALALFVGTIGERISNEIQSLFSAGDPASGAALDAYASETTNRIAYALAAEYRPSALGPRPSGFSEGRRPRAEGRVSVLPYSPGYCGWHVSGQRALFEATHPADIGVTLNGSCLMTPLKSVSGVLVGGDPAIHRFRPAYAFCDECSTHECASRMASVRR